MSHHRSSALFGVGRRDITPPPGIHFKSWGAATREVAKGVHRPFYVTALTVRAQPNDAPLVLVALDGGWWQAAVDERFVREHVLTALGLPESNLIINLSHTHAGPSLSTDNANRPGGEHIGPYLERMREAIVEAARYALMTEAEGELRWATGRCDLATNRGLPDPQGGRYVTGYNPNAAADDTVVVGRVTNSSGEVIATLMNYACHPTTLAWENELMSPEYIGAARATVEAATGNAPCLFLLGACGDLAPAHQYVGDVRVADGHGRQLGLAVLSTLAGMPDHGHDLAFDRIVESGAPLAVWLPRGSDAQPAVVAAKRSELDLPIKTDYPPLAVIQAELAEAKEPYLRERLTRKSRIRASLGDGATYAFGLWAWRVSGSVFLAYPGEAFSELQTDLRARFPELTIVVMNVSNGSIGYLPPARLYEENMYEVWQTPLERGCLETLQGACIEAIEELTA